MAGLDQMQWLQGTVIEHTGEDLVQVDPTSRTIFTYASSTKGESYGRVGAPHPLGLTAQRGLIWFTMVPTASPTRLGLDYLEAAGADFEHTGFLSFPDGHREPLVKLRSGHWALPLL